MKTKLIRLAVSLLCAGPLCAQQHIRKYTNNSAKPIQPIEAAEKLPIESRYCFEISDGNLNITANGIPNHEAGLFPNRHNPHKIEEQRHLFKLPVNPEPGGRIYSLYTPKTPGHKRRPNMPFGIALNGVMIDPGTAEFWNGHPQSGWNYEALGGAVPLGLDEHYAHVQPDGAYHYHGIPQGLLNMLGWKKGRHSPQIGWAADGFPIYALYGYDGKNTTEIIQHTSSYRLKQGTRPKPPAGPGGMYDGAFVQDYKYVEGAGTLDECNGTFTAPPEFPDGTYAYFLTEKWPVISRMFKGNPVRLHEIRRPLRHRRARR